MPSDYDQIRADNIKEYGEGTRHLAFLGRLYTDRTHFIFELLQNAEDADASKILFELFEDRLEVRHDGRPFNERDVRGVCGVGEGTKAEDLTQIGKFGIGFKSVYAYTSAPEVHSGEEHFRIEHYVRPDQAATKGPGDSWTTLFVFAFDAPSLERDTACREIAARLRNMSARTLLFLRKIKEIEYKLPDETGGVYLREETPRGPARQVTVIGQNNGQDEDENWLVFERSLPVPDGAYSVRVEIGFKLETNAKDQVKNISKIKDSPLVVYFPTEKQTRFGFLIQGPYRTTPSRDNIPKDDDWNTTLVKETAVLITEALQNLKEMGLLTVALLEALPIRMDDFPEDGMFYPIVEAVRDALIDQEMLPADDGTFVSARNAKLASAEWLRTLLRDEQLRQLFKTENLPKWISGEITERAKHDLWKYIREELKVEEVTPDSFVRKMEGSFLEKQTDDWMIAFYTQLVGQKALWKKGSNTLWDTAGPLRAKQFIRLQDGSHVRPFRDDGSPNAYLTVGANTETSLPIVKAELSQHEDARRFLGELGIPELDIVAEVIEKVLPKYSFPVPFDEHWRDIEKIVRAYTTDSNEKKQRLREQLQATPFIITEKPGLETNSYLRPTEAYFQNDELMAYFSGSDTIGFINRDYPQSMLEIFRELGASDGIRISCKSRPGSAEDLLLEFRFGYRRGLRGFDPEIQVEGLEHALMNISVKKSEIIWNKIALQYSHCIKGKILRSSRQDFSRYARAYREEDVISDFGRLLIDTAWLSGPDGKFHKPSELSLDDLPGSFVRDEKLADQLGMKMDVIATLAEEVGVTVENIEFLKQHPEEFQKWKANISANEENPVFPTRPFSNPERRKEKIIEKYWEAPKKKYEQKSQSIKTTENIIDPKTWLNESYKNNKGELICQICKKEMPFKRRNGNYYFEAIELLNNFDRELEDLHIALCPLCAAMYNEFVKHDEDAMESFKNALMDSEQPEVPLRLGEFNTSVRFVESHYHDIKTILGAQE